MDGVGDRPKRFSAMLIGALGGAAGGGVILIAVAALAMIAVNSPLHDGYEALFQRRLAWTPLAALDTAHAWINDGLMAVFFFSVGLEIKREVTDGDLSDARRRRLPVIAALAGMVVPALCYLAITGADTALGPALRRGWAIPDATDIAFAAGVVALLGRRVPPALRLFLLTVAIVDDLGAVTIIALFYTSAIALGWLLAAAAVLAVMVALARLRVSSAWAYSALAVVLWVCVLHSGVHATIAGVLAALTIPMVPGPFVAGKSRDSLLLRLEHALQPWVTYLIVPLFAFANAGVVLSGGLRELAGPLPLGVAIGLFVGKPVGVFGAVYAAERLGLAARPDGAGWLQIWGIAILCGIGFTMSLFIGGLAFADDPDLFEQAKLGVIAGSLLSIVSGIAVLWLGNRGRRAA